MHYPQGYYPPYDPRQYPPTYPQQYPVALPYHDYATAMYYGVPPQTAPQMYPQPHSHPNYLQRTETHIPPQYVPQTPYIPQHVPRPFPNVPQQKASFSNQQQSPRVSKYQQSTKANPECLEISRSLPKQVTARKVMDVWKTSGGQI